MFESTGNQPRTGFFGLTRNPVPRWVAYLQIAVFVGVGVALLIGGIRRYDAVQPLPGGRTATGSVVAVSTGQNCGRHGCSTYWVPTIQFTANGHDVSFAGPESGSAMNTGEQVQVSYDPGNPAVARDMSAGTGNAWILIVLGALAILAGPVSFLLGFRRLHATLNLTSARDDGSGWVGHSGLHSVGGISVGVAVMAAFVILRLVTH
jgi:Protein of unknown function (DUF3592)